VTFIQLFGSSLAANPHLHMMFLDGVYASSGRGPRFYEQPEFTTETVMTIFEMIYQRLMRLFAKKGYVDTSGEASVLEDIDSDVPMPFRPRSPKAYRRKGRLAPPNKIITTISHICIEPLYSFIRDTSSAQ
jgi:hypothetical protein